MSTCMGIQYATTCNKRQIELPPASGHASLSAILCDFFVIFYFYTYLTRAQFIMEHENNNNNNKPLVFFFRNHTRRRRIIILKSTV